MPKPVYLKEKYVVLNEENAPIINCYIDKLKEAGAFAQTSRAAVVPGEKRERSGLFAVFLNRLEDLTKTPQSGKMIPLPPDELSLEMPADDILTEYLIFLNTLTDAQNLSADIIEKHEIDSKFALVRELLYRGVACALSNNEAHNGIKLIAGLQAFITAIRKQGLIENDNKILNIKLLAADISSFSALLAQPYGRQLTEKVQKMASVVALIHSNRQVITNVVKQLYLLKTTITKHLIAHFDVYLKMNFQAMDLEERLLDSNLIKCQDELLKTKPSPQIEGEIGRAYPLLTSQEMQILAIVKESNANNRDPSSLVPRLIELYTLRKSTDKLIELISYLDRLMLLSGWLSVLKKAFNFNNLMALIKDHFSNSAKILIIPDGHPIRSAAVGSALHAAPTGNELEMGIQQAAEDFMQLESVIPFITDCIKDSLLSLIREQQKYPLQYHFINQLSLESGVPSFKLPPPPADGLQSAYTPRNPAINLLYKLLEAKEERAECFKNFNVQNSDLQQQYTHGNYPGFTALHIAAVTGNLVACEWLLTRGLDINIMDGEKDTPLDKAYKKIRICIKSAEEKELAKVIDYLLLHGGKGEKAIRQHSDELHKRLDHWSPLTPKENLEQVKNLVRAGADTDSIDPSSELKYRILHKAFMIRDENLMTFLLSRAKCLTPLDNERQTPYQRLLMTPSDNQKAVKFLQQNFPDTIVVATSSTAEQAFLQKLGNKTSAVKILIVNSSPTISTGSTASATSSLTTGVQLKT